MAMYQAWHTAAFPLMKKFPKLKDVIGPAKAPKKQSWEDQLAIAQQWAAVG